MILIFSMLSDGTTTAVCNWLKFHKAEFTRINSEDEISFDKLDLLNQNFSFMHNGKLIESREIKAVWYRRGGFQHTIKPGIIYNDSYYLNESGQMIHYHVRKEYEILISFMQTKIEANKSIGSFHKASLNKLEILDVANQLGLTIPKSWVISKKSQLFALFEKYKIVTKAIHEGLYHIGDQFSYHTYTNEIKSSDINNFPETFTPSLIQEKIEKKYELRIFYLKGKTYSMAIFSQKNSKTQVDFRMYDHSKPNRVVPYQLPDNIETKINKLFASINLNTGSVDMVVDKFGNYVFLEINPIGQFTMTSKPCNYNLEEIMALELIKIKNENETAKDKEKIKAPRQS